MWKLIGGVVLLLTIEAASASDRWAYCEGCSASGASHLARSVPPDSFSSSRVHVLDTKLETLHSFHVQVFFDYEFRSWLRLATPADTSSAALRQFEGWLTLKRLIARLVREPQAVEIASVAAWHTQGVDVAYDALIRSSGVESAALQAGLLAASAVSDVPVMTLRFADDSQANVQLTQANGEISLVVMEEQFSDPAGWPLPADESDLAYLDLIGDPGRMDYLRRYVLEAFGWSVWLRDALAEGHRYRIVCGGWPTPDCEITRL